MAKESGWFTVDKDGLAKLVRRKGVAFILYELVQNGWDTNATFVDVDIEPLKGRRAAKLVVYDDDPDGFKDLSHAYTLYAPSEKKDDATKRGRFNLGEKLVLAACNWASIVTTTGTVRFQNQGGKLQRHTNSQGLARGSQFVAELPFTREEIAQFSAAANLLLPPIRTVVNGVILPKAKVLATFEVSLPTEIADAEGYLRPTSRKTEVEVVESEDPHIYEMGIPVVETDFPWSVNVKQKIPLNADRDNVTPRFRRELMTAALNHMHSEVQEDDINSPCIQEALENPKITPEAVQAVITKRHGDKVAVFDPSDQEANHTAAANGYALIAGRNYNKAQWENIRQSGVTTSAGKLFPSPKLYGDGPPVKTIPPGQQPEGMKAVVSFTHRLAEKLLGTDIQVVVENALTQPYVANYGHGVLVLNCGRLGFKWFDMKSNLESIVDLLIHEFGHHYASSHLDSKYHDALTRLGAKTTQLALIEPDFFSWRAPIG